MGRVALAVSDFFRGKAVNGIDRKGRVSVPSDFRATILTRHRRMIAEDGFDPSEGDADTRHANAGKVVIVLKDRERPCLEAFENAYVRDRRSEINQRYEELRGAERETAVRRDLAVFGRSEDLALDVNGRIMLGPRLCQKIGVDPAAENGIDNLVFFYALGEVFEIWHPLRFAEAIEAEDPDTAEDVRAMVEDRQK